MSAVVVTLPTAAPRKVRQCWSRTRQTDRDALLRFPTKAVRSSVHDIEQARHMLNSDHRSAMCLAVAIYSVLTKDQKPRAIGKLLAQAAACQSNAPREALAWAQFADASYERQRDIADAFRFIADEEAE